MLSNEHMTQIAMANDFLFFHACEPNITNINQTRMWNTKQLINRKSQRRICTNKYKIIKVGLIAIFKSSWDGAHIEKVFGMSITGKESIYFHKETLTETTLICSMLETYSIHRHFLHVENSSPNIAIYLQASHASSLPLPLPPPAPPPK